VTKDPIEIGFWRSPQPPTITAFEQFSRPKRSGKTERQALDRLIALKMAQGTGSAGDLPRGPEHRGPHYGTGNRVIQPGDAVS